MPALRPPMRPASATIMERIEALENEIEALIADHIAREKAMTPGVPEGVLRQMFDVRYGHCACGSAISEHVLPGENAKGIAMRLGLRHWRSQRDQDGNGFWRPTASLKYEWRTPC